jgi:hypothetical protein
MDAITQAFQSIQPILKPATEVASIGSTAYNMYNQYQQQQYQDKLRSLSTDPAAVSKLAAGYTQPLTAGLEKGVANNTQAYLAERGLTESPQISQEVQSQAIAPYIQQNQQQGYSLALQALGLGGGAINPAYQKQDSMSALAKAFAQMPGLSKPGTDPSAVLQNYLRTMGTQPQQTPSPYSAPPGPIDVSSWDSGTPDLSSFYQPNYASAGADGVNATAD